MRTYASLAAVKPSVGLPASSTSEDEALALALVGATHIVDRYANTGEAADDVWTGDADDLEVVAAPRAQLVTATVYVAVRLYKTPDAPFGFAGMSDQGLVAYVRSAMPELGVILYGIDTALPGIS